MLEKLSKRLFFRDFSLNVALRNRMCHKHRQLVLVLT